MKIWYQSLTRPSAWEGYNSALRDVLNAAKDVDTEIEVHGILKRGGIGDQYRYLEFIEAQEVLENVEQASQQGFDAFLIGNICDPGIREAREITNIPVLGLGETSFHLASFLGANFSLVTGTEKHLPKITENVRKYGLHDNLHSVHAMQVTRLVDLDEGFTSTPAKQALVEQFLVESELAVAKGAEVIIPAVGVLMVLLAQQNIHSTKSNVPILSGVNALVKMGEMAVRLRRLMQGSWTSRRNMYARPPCGQIDEIRAAYGGVYSDFSRDIKAGTL